MANEITKKERKKMVLWALFVVLGIMFGSGIRELLIDDLFDKYPPALIILLSLICMALLYYFIDTKG